jgi:hypothetical protein
VDTAWGEPWRCAFMAWDDPLTHPARAPVSHRNGATGFSRLDIVVPDLPVALSWLGAKVPAGVVAEVGTEPGIKSLHLSAPAGDIPIG